MSSCVVVGSANVDLVVPITRYPAPGETLLGGDLARHPGGKGANQAVAAARAGGVDTTFVGCLGSDDSGNLLRESLASAGVRIDLIGTGTLATGTALIWVTQDGGNTIVVSPGANSEITLGARERERIASANAVLAQLEIPLEVVREAAAITPEHARFILNAAPSTDIPADLLDNVDVLVLNEPEAADVAKYADDLHGITERLLRLVPAAVVTLGDRGCLVAERRGKVHRLPPHEVKSVDTTGAGDTFCGTLAAAIAQGRSLQEAAQRATAAGALSVTKHGAMDSVPTAQELDTFIADRSD